jgi:hypothetical protein
VLALLLMVPVELVGRVSTTLIVPSEGNNATTETTNAANPATILQVGRVEPVTFFSDHA